MEVGGVLDNFERVEDAGGNTYKEVLESTSMGNGMEYVLFVNLFIMVSLVQPIDLFWLPVIALPSTISYLSYMRMDCLVFLSMTPCGAF